MSRPFRTLFALCLVAFSVGMSGCDTIYRPVYSNEKNYFKPDSTLTAKGGPQLTAEQILQQTSGSGAGYNGATVPADPNAMPPAPPAAPDALPAAPATPAPPQ